MISLKTPQNTEQLAIHSAHRGGKWCDEKRSASSLEAVVFSPSQWVVFRHPNGPVGLVEVPSLITGNTAPAMFDDAK